VGNDGANVLTGSSLSDTITGGANADTITGGAGVDVLDGGTGDDTYVYATSAAFVTASEVVDSINDAGGTADRAVITGAISIADADTLARAGGVEQLVAATVADDGNPGLGGLVHSIVIDSNADLSDVRTINLAASADAQSTGVINLTGVTVATTLTGVVAGQNTLTGGDGADTITGGNVADTITGGAGVDSLTGGAGSDTYVFNTGDVNDGERLIEAANGGTDRILVNTSTDFGFLAAADLNEIEEILIGAGQTATFTGAQLTGKSFAVNETGAGTTNLLVNVAASTTVTLSSLTFGAFTGGDAFDDAGDTVTINSAAGNTAETITGTSLSDTINSDAGNDTIFGGGGHDTIVGGAGADSLQGDAGNDVFVISTAGHETGDSLNGGSNSDTLRLDATGTVFAAGQFSGIENIVINAAAATTTVAGSLLTGTSIQIDGQGAGAEGLVISVASGVTMNFGLMTFGGNFTDGNDTVSITTVAAASAVNITGTTISDSITGGDGDDTLDGGSGDDTLNGGAGFDVVSYASETNDLTVDLSSALAQVTGLDSGIDSLTSIEKLIAGSGNDNITGSNSASNYIVGGNGNDTITGGARNDTLQGGEGSDSLSGGNGDDRFVFGSSAEMDGDATILGGEGTDTLWLDTGAANIGFDDNAFDKISGVEVLHLGGTGGYVFSLGTNANTAFSTRVTVTSEVTGSGVNLNGSTLNKDLYVTGTNGRDTITGGGGADSLNGGLGNDSLTGGFGADTLQGGAGTDTLTGGGSIDTFILDNRTNGGVDTITDFAEIEDLIKFFDATFYRDLSANSYNALSLEGALAQVAQDLAATAGGSSVGGAAGFTYYNESYVFVDGGNDGYLAANDAAVKLSGVDLSLLSHTTFIA
jgi:Ca2+-binding RTX toxin-like protein